MTVTQDKLKEIFEYKDGFLLWRIKTAKKVNIGDIAGCKIHRGYRSIRINFKHYLAHRLIFMYHYGYMPNLVDHIDNNTENNHIENLREASNCENLYNSKTPTSNKSGVKGVHWSKIAKKWVAKITINKVPKSLGYYDDLELAALVVEEARDKYHKHFARI